jgi:plasmid stabilization system protein ParE
MTHTVEITDAAYDAIRAQARYIAVDCQAPLNASRWLKKVWDAIDGLAHMPARHNLAHSRTFNPPSLSFCGRFQ